MMPLHEYECLECQTRTEKIQRFSDPPLTSCPSCGAGLKRLLHAPAVRFKGTGWYVTDYAGKSEKGEAEKGEASDKSSSSASEEPSSTSTAKDPKPATEKASSASQSD